MELQEAGGQRGPGHSQISVQRHSVVLKRAGSQIVKRAAVVRDVIRHSPAGAVVLLYHRVGGGSGLAVDLPVPLFSSQIHELADSARVLSLDALLAVVSRAQRPAQDPLAITFDDGTADFAELALPMLEAARLPVTLYVATDFIQARRPFPREGTPLSWDALRDCLTTGLVTVGSHTHTHALLDRVGYDEAAQELDRSIKLIEDHLGVTPQHFAYPKALLGSPVAQAAVRERFSSACVAGTRPNAYGRTDPYRLSRSPVQVGDGMRWFRHKMRGGMGFEDDVRRLVNRRRYAGAVT